MGSLCFIGYIKLGSGNLGALCMWKGRWSSQVAYAFFFRFGIINKKNKHEIDNLERGEF